MRTVRDNEHREHRIGWLSCCAGQIKRQPPARTLHPITSDFVERAVQADLGESRATGNQSGIFYPDKSFDGCEVAQYYNAEGISVGAVYNRKGGYLTDWEVECLLAFNRVPPFGPDWVQTHSYPNVVVALYLNRRLRSQVIHDLNTVNYCT
jgi:hypothetical protein